MWIFWEGGVSEGAFAQEIDSVFLRLDAPGMFAIQTETRASSVGVDRELFHASIITGSHRRARA